MRLPQDDEGYAVDESGLVHTRYATHSTGHRTRTKAGAEAAGGNRVCRECYPLKGTKKGHDRGI